MTIKVSRAYDEIGDVERKETFAIETARISLRQHKGLADLSLSVNVTKIGPCEETVVATGAKHHPTGV